jgi:16S rRNA processing protein RimM
VAGIPADQPRQDGANPVAVGIVTRFNPNKLELVITPLTDRPERFDTLKKVFVHDGAGTRAEYAVAGVRYSTHGVHMKLDGVTDRNVLAGLVHKHLMAETADAQRPSGNTYFIDDILNAAVLVPGGETLGTVTGIYETGANDVYVVAGKDGREYLLPALASVIAAVDTAARTITVTGRDAVDRYNDTD